MAYEKTNWTTETPIDIDNLNKMEQGIEDAGKTGGILEGTIVGYDGDTIPEGYEEVDNPNVVEIIENENGTAIKFSDGTMECYFKQELGTITFNSAYGNIFYEGSSAKHIWSFPEKFVDNENLVINADVYLGGGIGGCCFSTIPSATEAIVWIWHATATELQNCILEWRAIGRWK